MNIGIGIASDDGMPPDIGQPGVIAAPTITGTPVHGDVLTGVHGSYTNSPTSYTQQWFSGNVAIPGATSTTYTVQLTDVGKYVTFVEYPANAAGVIGASSAGTLITS